MKVRMTMPAVLALVLAGCANPDTVPPRFQSKVLPGVVACTDYRDPEQPAICDQTIYTLRTMSPGGL